jgi:hypothetical protein
VVVDVAVAVGESEVNDCSSAQTNASGFQELGGNAGRTHTRRGAMQTCNRVQPASSKSCRAGEADSVGDWTETSAERADRCVAFVKLLKLTPRWSDLGDERRQSVAQYSLLPLPSVGQCSSCNLPERDWGGGAITHHLRPSAQPSEERLHPSCTQSTTRHVGV